MRAFQPCSPGHRPALDLHALEDRTVPSAPAPVYTATFGDAVTADNATPAANGARVWTIDAGADSYQTDTYERPTAQTFEVRRTGPGAQVFAAKEYFANLDLVQGRAGYDANFLYVSMELAGLDKRTEDGTNTHEGLIYQYGFRLANQPDGGGGILVVADQPGEKLGTTFGGVGTFVYRDANGDVGGVGRDVTKQDRPAEVGGNGYEQVAASDGRTAGGAQVVFARVSPTSPTTVEFAVRYSAFGFTEADLANPAAFDIEANKGTKDPGNYLWNDEYTKSEAGSPYRATTGDLTKSEFGTQGLGNIYELDTLRGGAIRGQASLAGSVYFDANGNGVRDLGDVGLAGVGVTLTGNDLAGNEIVREVVTDGNGAYSFADLPAGTYQIAEEQPAGYDDGEDYLGTVNGETRGLVVGNDVLGQIELAAGEAGVAYDFLEVTPQGPGDF